MKSKSKTKTKSVDDDKKQDQIEDTKNMSDDSENYQPNHYYNKSLNIDATVFPDPKETEKSPAKKKKAASKPISPSQQKQNPGRTVRKSTNYHDSEDDSSDGETVAYKKKPNNKRKAISKTKKQTPGKKGRGRPRKSQVEEEEPKSQKEEAEKKEAKAISTIDDVYEWSESDSSISSDGSDDESYRPNSYKRKLKRVSHDIDKRHKHNKEGDESYRPSYYQNTTLDKPETRKREKSSPAKKIYKKKVKKQTTQKQTPGKRGRGRPKKVVDEEKDVDEISEEQDAATTPNVEVEPVGYNDAPDTEEPDKEALD